MKKICASRLSAKGVARSNAFAREMRVEPTIGATRSATARRTPNESSVTARRRLMGVISRASNGNDCETPRARVARHFGIDAVERAHGLHRQDIGGRSGRED